MKQKIQKEMEVLANLDIYFEKMWWKYITSIRRTLKNLQIWIVFHNFFLNISLYIATSTHS